MIKQYQFSIERNKFKFLLLCKSSGDFFLGGMGKPSNVQRLEVISNLHSLCLYSLRKVHVLHALRSTLRTQIRRASFLVANKMLSLKFLRSSSLQHANAVLHLITLEHLPFVVI